jgi:hypothetical protein
MAVMNIGKGEDILSGYATVCIPQVGICKLLVKKKNLANRGETISKGAVTILKPTTPLN